MKIAKGLLSEDDYLLTEILFNPYTYGQVEDIRFQLKHLLELIKNKDSEGMKEFYEESGMRFVSTHPMFGPTFANLKELQQHHAIIISESDHLGKAFFKDFYSSLGLNIHEYSFDEHDKTIAYSLSIPFSSSLVFAAVMKHQKAPGTTFNKHMKIAKGLLSEDDYLLTEILFNPYTYGQVEDIRFQLKHLLELIKDKDSEGMKKFLAKVRDNLNER